MATLSDSLVSSSARRLAIRKRPDLSARRQHYLGRTYWVVKEPVGLNYFRFQEEEYALLQKLDGHTSLDELKEWFEAEFPPQKITLEELQQFIGMLHRSGLVIADVPGQGKQLRQRRLDRRRKEILGALANILCIRFKGFDPERFLNWLYPKARWLYSAPVFCLCLVLMISAASLVIVQFDEFRAKLPSFYQFFSPHNALWLAIVLGLTKVLHEFGHGLTCKHYGGECHEMGVMILVLTPCLYCNVSDSWMLPSKWQRAAIGAAGMYVEVVIASIATFVWWFTSSDPPTLLNMLCLNVIFISSVSTILFNANPLLRYDGYYILADLTEIPNLRQKATTILSRKAAHWFLGIEPQEDPFLPERNQFFFVIYSVAAAVYRWFVVLSILWFLNQVFKPYGLAIIGHVIVAMSMVGLVVMPLYKLGKFFYTPGRMYKVKKPRLYASLAGLGAIILAFVFVPLPHSVLCSLEVQPRNPDRVFVRVPGTLEACDVQPGQRVEEGQVLGRLSNPDIDFKIAELDGKKRQLETRIEQQQRQSHSDPEAAAELGELREALASIKEQIAQHLVDKEKLILRAPASGTIMPPPWKPHKPGVEGQLASWWGTPLEPRNVGVPLDVSDAFCLVGDPARMEAVLYIDQGDIEFVARDQTVEIKLDELPFETFTGTIADKSPSESKISPHRLSTRAGGDLPTKMDEAGVERPMSTSYPAKVYLDDPEGLLRIGLRGRAKIHTRWQTLGQRAWRLLNQVITFKL
ncbi:MAG: hemolysin D [Pirellulales bacterium]|nr:hemolysin D [Pirellulales bacterium]